MSEPVAYIEIKMQNCKDDPIPIHCKGCGKLIGRVDHINQLERFKRLYGPRCGFCDRLLNKYFDVKEMRLKR